MYLEIGKHTFRVWDRGPMEPEPVGRVPCCSKQMADDEIASVYTEVVDLLRGSGY